MSRTTEIATPSQTKLPLLWPIRLLALVAMGVSAYLAVLAFLHSGPAGCGGTGGCEDVLTSRWSTWFGVPVSVFAVATYAVLLLGTFRVIPTLPPSTRRKGWGLLVFAASAAAGAAIWFVALQLFLLRHYCLYCLTVHACGFLTAILVVRSVPVKSGRASAAQPGRPGAVPLGGLMLLLALGFVAVGALIAGQIFAPAASYRVTRLGGPSSSPDPAGRVSVAVDGKTEQLDPKVLPVLGGSDATQRFIVMLGDYTCSHCRVTHQMLDRLLPRYGGKIAVVMLPTPLDPKCNPMVSLNINTPPQACALAKLALAVWCANPEKFEQMNQYLFDSPDPRSEADARFFAGALVGSAKLKEAESDPRITQIIRNDCDLYGRLNKGPIPKLLIGQTLTNGTVNDPQIMIGLIRKEWGMTPAGEGTGSKQ